MYAEFVGLTTEAIVLIEQCRRSPSESKSEILVRALSSIRQQPTIASEAQVYELGQGAHLSVGEKPLLFLSVAAKREGRPDAVAEIKSDGFYLDGRKIEPSNGSVLQPAMQVVQERKNHRNSEGKLISLSAWRQWHVVRKNKLIPLIELKDPSLARKRGRALTSVSKHSLEELGL